MRSIRARVAVAAAAAVGLVVLVAGTTLMIFVSNEQRALVDDRLERQLSLLDRVLVAEIASRVGGVADPEGRILGIDAGIRILRGDDVVLALGDLPAGLPHPDDLGFATTEADGDTWRTLTGQLPETVTRGSGGEPLVAQVASSLEPTEQVVREVRRRVVAQGVIAISLAAAAGWVFGRLALRPLDRLRSAAERVASTSDLTVRVPDLGDRPAEVSALARSLDAMLERLEESAAAREQALDAARSFTASAAHELRTPLTSMQANLETLARNPDLPEPARREIIGDVVAQQAKLVALLEGLQKLARGDLTAAGLTRERVDIAELVDTAVLAARHRHPRASFELSAPDEAVMLDGWSDGLRVLVDNLLDNAAHHGPANGDGAVGVRVAVEPGEGTIRLVVDDDGVGIPPDERHAVLDRFVRGSATRSPGSGLGLALVDQQARIHGGTVSLGDSPLGGLRVAVALPVSRDGAAPTAPTRAP